MKNAVCNEKGLLIGWSFMLANKLKPPIPTRPAWVAYVVVVPALLIALLSSPIWMGAYGAMKLMKKLLRARKRPRSQKPEPFGHINGRADGARQPLQRA